MGIPLNDPWFDAKFLGEIEESQACRYLDGIEGAQGIFLWCPCGYGKPEFPLDGGRPHGLMLPFRNPRNAPVPPDSFNRQADGRTPRWEMSGSGLADLTMTPSIAIGKPECWHGYITQGQIVL
jgi:hypothetical protein